MKKFLIILVLIIIIIIVYIITKELTQNKSEPEIKGTKTELLTYTNEENGFRLKYPGNFVIGNIPEKEDNKDPIIIRLVSPEPAGVIMLKKESGLGALNLFVKKPLLEYLKSNIDKRYEIEYNDFKKERVEEIKLAGLDAFTVWFTFQDPDVKDKERIKLTVTVKDNVGYYIQCMAPVKTWSQTDESCNQVIESFEFINNS